MLQREQNKRQSEPLHSLSLFCNVSAETTNKCSDASHLQLSAGFFSVSKSSIKKKNLSFPPIMKTCRLQRSKTNRKAKGRHMNSSGSHLKSPKDSWTSQRLQKVREGRVSGRGQCSPDSGQGQWSPEEAGSRKQEGATRPSLHSTNGNREE